MIYRYKTGEDPSTAEVFLDPNTFKEDGIRDYYASRGLGDVYKRQNVFGSRKTSEVLGSSPVLYL